MQLSACTNLGNATIFENALPPLKQTNLGNGEESNPREDDEGHGVEPAADVGEEPEGDAELDGIQHVLHEEESSELSEGAVDLLGGGGGNALDLVAGDGKVAL